MAHLERAVECSSNQIGKDMHQRKDIVSPDSPVARTGDD